MKNKISPDQEIGSELTITERNQFFSINEKQGNQIKSLRIENQSIDEEIVREFCKFNDELEKLYFVNYFFSSIYVSFVLSNFPGIKKIGFIRCNLSYDILKLLLCAAAPYNNFDSLDLTGNGLGKDSIYSLKFYINQLCCDG